MGFHHNIGEHHFITGPGDAVAKLKVVRQIVNKGAQTADRIQRGARHGQRGAQGKVNAPFDLPRHQNAGNKIRTDAEGFQL